jgi:hypothetical protein
LEVAKRDCNLLGGFMKTINVEELIDEAKVNLMRDTELAMGVMLTPYVEDTILSLLAIEPTLIEAMAGSPIKVKILQTICLMIWETGRLYGRAEVVRETMGE